MTIWTSRTVDFETGVVPITKPKPGSRCLRRRNSASVMAGGPLALGSGY